MSPELTDEAILAACKPQFPKMARVLGDVATALDVHVKPVPPSVPEKAEDPRGINPEIDVIVDRIKALVKAKRLESAGNLNRWRYSEIRLTGK
jgi:Protein of unknown function